jgi:hypothetical protein
MNGRRRFSGLRITLLASALALCAAPAPPARASAAPACTCVTLSPDINYITYTSVFAGKATEVKYLDPPETRSEPRIIVTFKVLRSWKGPEASTEFVLHTVYNGHSCYGYHFQKGKEYLVFARRNKEHDAKEFAPHELPEVSYGTNLCSGTRLLADAAEDIKILDEICGGGAAAPAPGGRR